MIKYIQFNERFSAQVNNLIHNIMKNELEIETNIITSITRDLENIYKNYIEDGGNFWIAIDNKNNTVVGTVGIKKINNCSAEFKRFYVKDEYRNKHIGYNLYKIAEDFIKKNKIEKLYLVSGNKSKKAHNIYYKNGWELGNKHDVNIFIRDGVDLYKKEFTYKLNILKVSKDKNCHIDFYKTKCIRSLVG